MKEDSGFSDVYQIEIQDKDGNLENKIANITELTENIEKRAAVMLAEDLRRMHESAYWHNYMKEAPPEAGEYLVAYHPAYWSKVDRSKMEVGLDHYRRGKASPGDRSKWARNKYRETVFWMEKPRAPFKEMWPKEYESEGSGNE